MLEKPMFAFGGRGPLRWLRYRLRQTIHAVQPEIHDHDADYATEILGAGELALFHKMEKRDRRHGIEVMGRLHRHGIGDRDLLAAALLHDCGKGEAAVWLRGLNVVAGPAVRVLGIRDGAGWRGAAYRLAYHAAIGAEFAVRAGSSAATVRYISGRVGPGEEAKIALLRWADDIS